MPFKDTIIIWTLDLPDGYGVCDQDEEIINEPEIIEEDESSIEIQPR
jgi:hypothetical protein